MAVTEPSKLCPNCGQDHSLEVDFWDREIPKAVASHDRMREIIEKLTDPEFPIYHSEREEVAECLDYLMHGLETHEVFEDETITNAFRLGFRVKKALGRKGKAILDPWIAAVVYGKKAPFAGGWTEEMNYEAFETKCLSPQVFEEGETYHWTIDR